MTETFEPRILETPKQPRKFKLKVSDIIIFGVILVVIAILIATIFSRLSLKHEVANARVVSDKVMNKVATQDATGLRALADKKFQSDHSVTELQPLLKPIAQIYGKTTPVIDRQTVANTGKAQNVIFIYKYDRLKVPFFVRVTISEPHGTSAWHLVNIGGNADESLL